jgi:hypothetical protein
MSKDQEKILKTLDDLVDYFQEQIHAQPIDMLQLQYPDPHYTWSILVKWRDKVRRARKRFRRLHGLRPPRGKIFTDPIRLND